MITNIKDIPNNIAGIYKIIYDNNKVYIGQALNIKNRALEHNNKSKELCDIALKKHDAIIEILQEISDIDLLDCVESFYINKYNATNREYGYNILKYGNASGKRGIDNCNAMLNQQQLNEVIDLLLNHHEISCKDIAKKYNVNEATIYRISYGQSYINPSLKYPLRENIHSFSEKNKIEDYFQSQEDLLSLKDDLLYRWDLSIEIDLVKKYNIPLKIIREINQGKKFSNTGTYNYPIRKNNIRNNNNFTLQDIINILDDLRNTKMSMTEIGNKYHINRSTVSKINNGLTYIIKNYNYPARQFKL